MIRRVPRADGGRTLVPLLLFLVCCLPAPAVGSTAPEANPSLFECPTAPAPETPLDQLVFADLAQLRVEPVLCSDAVFVRRVYLDVIGTLPTAEEVREFHRDPDTKHKRSSLIDRLLEREEFADYWAMRWGDVLRIKAEFPINLWPNAAQAYHRWVRTAIAQNRPYDQFVRELLTSSGSNFRVGPVNFYRAMQDRTPDGVVRAVALTFMGARADAWPADRLADTAVFFSQIGYKPTGEWKEEHVFWDPWGASAVAANSAPGRPGVSAIGQASNAVAQPALPLQATPPRTETTFPDGRPVTLPPNTDPRMVFADWLLAPENPWFARCAVNRVWAWLLGRGIVHEPDDIREDNPPVNPALLAYLEQQFNASHFNLKELYRLILNSQTYQLSSMPCDATQTPEATARFARYPLRRLDAELLIDAINKITGSSDLYTSPIPEPFTYLPEEMPAIAIGDGSITSPFLALFGRPARATGMASERDNRPLPAQWLHLLNSSHIQRKLERSPHLREILDFRRSDDEIAEELYLTILSRPPAPDELGRVTAYVAASAESKNRKPNRAEARAAWQDVAWALINSTEFVYRH